MVRKHGYDSGRQIGAALCLAKGMSIFVTHGTQTGEGDVPFLTEILRCLCQGRAMGRVGVLLQCLIVF